MFGYYYKICNNIDLESYDDDLIEAMNFDKYNYRKFQAYLENKKILIDEDNYKRYIDLFVFLNFDDNDDVNCISYRSKMRSRVINKDHLDSFIHQITNTGYVLTLTDIIHFPYVGVNYESSNVNYDNNKCTHNEILHLLTQCSDSIFRMKHLLLNCKNDEIKLFGKILSININKSELCKLYNDIDIKPNRSHMLLMLNYLPDFKFATLKDIINFYDKHDVSVHERAIASARLRHSTNSTTVRDDTLKKLYTLMNQTESHKKLHHVKLNYDAWGNQL